MGTLGLSLPSEHVYGVHGHAPYGSGKWLTTFAHRHPPNRKNEALRLVSLTSDPCPGFPRGAASLGVAAELGEPRPQEQASLSWLSPLLLSVKCKFSNSCPSSHILHLPFLSIVF